MKKTLQELTIKDAFMFAAVMSDANQCRRFLSLVLAVKILEVHVVAEKSLAYHSEYKGVRLDVLAEEYGSKKRFNVEMQVKDRKNLPKRSRYYHAQMDMDALLAGSEYNSLPDTYVIFICDYDPLGKALYRYTLRNVCDETAEKIYDGNTTIWLSTAGENAEDVPAELVSFLQYVKNPSVEPGETEDDFVQEIRKRVAAVKQSRDWEAKFMLLKEMMEEERKAGREEGKLEGQIDSLLVLLDMLGTVPEELSEKIRGQRNPEVLKKWICLVREVFSIEEFQQRM